jgi:hypothetical protein
MRVFDGPLLIQDRQLACLSFMPAQVALAAVSAIGLFDSWGDHESPQWNGECRRD